LFLESITHALKLLGIGQFWIAVLLGGLLNMLPPIISEKLLVAGEQEGKTGTTVAGWLSYFGLGTIINGLTIGLFAVWVVPIIGGEGTGMPLSVLFSFDLIKHIAWGVCLGLLLIFALGLVPIVNQLMNAVAGIDQFVIGIVTFRIVAKAAGISPNYPGIFATLAYVILAGFIIKMGFLLSTMSIYFFNKKILGATSSEEFAGAAPAIFFWLMGPMGFLCAALPVCMYISYPFLS
jgi:hypothetical protein